MGHTLKPLIKAPIERRAVFDRRFVIELCERFHIHYRNLRIQLNTDDFIELATGVAKAYERWRKMGSTEPAKGIHVELCRKTVATDAINDGVQVNLNENLYTKHEGRIFAEGAELQEPIYVHVKYRDLRLEMTVEEFREFAAAIGEANGALEHCNLSPVLQKA